MLRELVAQGPKAGATSYLWDPSWSGGKVAIPPQAVVMPTMSSCASAMIGES